jgi:hypothetical protein
MPEILWRLSRLTSLGFAGKLLSPRSAAWLAIIFKSFDWGGFGCVEDLVGGLERVGESGYNCSLGLEF